MAVPKPIRTVAGSYTGESTLHMLWMPEGQQIDKGPSKLHIEFDQKQNFATVTYTWHYKGEEQEGSMLIASDEEGKDVTIGWTDSWHMRAGIMHLIGEVKSDEFSCKGKYAAPPGPDWGWRIVFDSSSVDKMTMKMFNSSPEGEETPAVEAYYNLDE